MRAYDTSDSLQRSWTSPVYRPLNRRCVTTADDLPAGANVRKIVAYSPTCSKPMDSLQPTQDRLYEST
ncbi:MAG: hypothetical protein FWF25_07150 [Propionibacteriaceae bacterium]|nr:hypothetical protein [Propionibacteriaceae bacterium]